LLDLPWTTRSTPLRLDGPRPWVPRRLPPQMARTKSTQRTTGRQIERPSALLSLSRAALSATKADNDGILRCRERRCLAIDVAPASLECAVQLMDALLQALDRQELQVAVAEPEEQYVWIPSSATLRRTMMPVTFVRVEGLAVPLVLEELTEAMPSTDPNIPRCEKRQRRPTGRLRLRVRSDLRSYPVDTALRKVVVPTTTSRPDWTELSTQHLDARTYDPTLVARALPGIRSPPPRGPPQRDTKLQRLFRRRRSPLALASGVANRASRHSEKPRHGPPHRRTRVRQSSTRDFVGVP
jgi:hypothetical protein